MDEALKNKDIYQKINLNTGLEVREFAQQFRGILLICSLRTKEDFLQIANLCKLQGLASIKNCKIVVINFSKNILFEKALAKLGVFDCIDGTPSLKTIKYKVDLWTKSLVNFYGANYTELNANLPVWENPLNSEDDIWLIRNESYCKKVLSKWMVKLLGPSPHVGKWIKVENRQDIWHFSLTENVRHDFLSAKSEWFYQGDQRPEFLWEENLWLFTGVECRLIHQSPFGEKIRLSVAAEKLNITKNSSQAKEKLLLIVKSFEKDLAQQMILKQFSGLEFINRFGEKDRETSEENLTNVISLENYQLQKPKSDSALEEAPDPIFESAAMSSTLTYYGKNLSVCFEDCYDDLIIFSSTDEGIETKSEVVVDLCFDYLGTVTLIKLEGLIVDLSSEEEGVYYLTIKVVCDQINKLKKILELYTVRQENINTFLEMVRGF